MSKSYQKRKLPKFKEELEIQARSSEIEDIAALLNTYFQSQQGIKVLEKINEQKQIIEPITKEKQIEYDEKLRNNVEKLMKDLPIKSSTNRQALIHYFSIGLPIKYCSALFSTSASSISAARSLIKEDVQKTLLFLKRANNCKRERITEYEKNSFKEFIEGETIQKGQSLLNPQPIGQLYSKFLEFKNQKNKESDEKNAQILKQQIENGELIPIISIKSRKTFNSLLKELNVKKMIKNWNFMDCPYCKSKYKEEILSRKQKYQDKLNDSGISEIERGEVNDFLEEVDKELKELNIHKDIMKAQREFEKETKDKIEEENDTESIMIHQDFTSVEFEEGKCQRSTIEDFILVLDKFDGNQWKRSYYDFLCDDPSKTPSSSFVIQAWDQLLQSGALDEFSKTWYLFSDGGSHFKNKFTMEYYTNLSMNLEIPIIYTIYAPVCFFILKLIQIINIFIIYCYYFIYF